MEPLPPQPLSTGTGSASESAAAAPPAPAAPEISGPDTSGGGTAEAEAKQGVATDGEEAALLQACNDERDELFIKYLWDGGTTVVWRDVGGELTQIERELVPDITQISEGYPTGKICPFVPSPAARTTRLAQLVGITADDVVLDVGCGDGRVLLHLASTVGCRCIGTDIDAELIEDATAAGRAAGPAVAALLEYAVEDFMQVLSVPAVYEANVDNVQPKGPNHLARVASTSQVGLADRICSAGVSCILVYLIGDALAELHGPLRTAARDLGSAAAAAVRMATQVYHYDTPAVPLLDDRCAAAGSCANPALSSPTARLCSAFARPWKLRMYRLAVFADTRVSTDPARVKAAGTGSCVLETDGDMESSLT